MAHKIVNIRTIIARERVRLLVLIKLENVLSEVYLTPEQIYQNTQIDVNELELLIGSYLRVEFYAVGEKMFNDIICNKPNYNVKEYYITLKDILVNLRELNQWYLKNYKEIKEIWSFDKFEKINVGVKFSESEKYYFDFNWLKKYTGIKENQLKSLTGSWMNPATYKIGETMFSGKKCNSENVLKELNIRFKLNYDSDDKSYNKHSNRKTSDDLVTYSEYLDLLNIDPADFYSDGNDSDWDDLPFSDPSEYPGSSIM